MLEFHALSDHQTVPLEVTEIKFNQGGYREPDSDWLHSPWVLGACARSDWLPASSIPAHILRVEKLRKNRERKHGCFKERFVWEM